MNHHIGAWMHWPASLSPHRDKGKPENNEILIAQVALRNYDRPSLSGIQPVKTYVHYL